MREIKFRGKRVDNGEWVHGFIISVSDGTWILKPAYTLTMCNRPLKTDLEVIQVDPATVGQLVKVTKKARFYEGDIITSRRYPFQDNGNYVYHGVIEWSNEDLAFFLVLRLADFERRGISNGIGELLSGYTLEGFYKLGNIHDNPELLEVKP